MARTNPAMTQMSHSSMSSLPFASSGGALRRDHLGVHARPAEAAEEAAVLDLHAAVLDHLQPGRLGLAPRIPVLDAELHPQHLRPDRDRVVRDGGDLRALP